MARAERPVDPGAGPVQRFAWELRQLREAAGRPTYRALSARVHYSASVLAEAAAGLSVPSLAVTLAYVRGCGGDAEEWQERWRRLVADVAGRDGSGAAEEPPYLGLSTFRTADADRFFGRRALTAELVRRVTEAPLLAVFGASGSGKSSLLRAGLLPALHGPSVVFTPGAEPLQELAAALARMGGGEATALLAALRSDPGAAGLAVRQAVGALDGEPLVIVVDQLEEVFTLCRAEHVRNRFLDCLLLIAEECADRARVVLGVRADFYAHCASHAGLVAALRDRQFLVGPMDEADLRAVITGPAERAGYRVEPALVDAVVADAAGQPGALPLISHALLETWRRRELRSLTLAGYRAAGEVREAIARTAEEVYAGLDAGRREVAEQIFLRLTAVGEGTQDTRRRVSPAELPGGPEAGEVLARLTAARLITRDEDAVTVAHEALIQRWPRLRDWLNTDREQLRAHRRLTEATAEWEQHGRDETFLYRGKRLALWEDRSLRRLNDAERAFLAAGQRREQRELTAARRRTRRMMSLLGVVVVVVTVLGAVSMAQARRAAGERDVSLANRLAADARDQLSLKPDLALLLSRRAAAVRRTPAVEAALRQSTADSRVRAILPAGHGQVFGVAYSADGRWIATSGDNGTVRLWRRGPDGAATGPPRELGGHEGEVWSPVFSADSRLLVACGVDGAVSVWDLAAGGTRRVLTGHDSRVWTAAFSPDGRRLVTAADDATVRIWDPVRGGPARTVLRVGGGWQISVAWSADGRHLAAGGGDGVIRLWKGAGTGTPALLRGHTGSVESLAFSRDGTSLVSGSTDGTARRWRTDGRGTPVVLRGQNGGTVESVAVSPDGHRVAAGGNDGTIRVFNADGDSDPLLLPGHDGPVWSVTFSPDGQSLLSGSGDGTARLWEARYPGEARVLRGHTGAVWCVAVSRDGGTVVSGSDDGTVRVWSPSGAGAPRVLKGHRGAVLGVSVSPDGARAVSAGDDGTVREWDVATGRAVVLTGHDGGVWEAVALPGGRHVVSAGADGTVRVWNLATRTAQVLRGHEGSVKSVAASPDGRHVASTGRDGTVRVWDVTGAGPPRILRGHEGGLVWEVTFSPDGRRLASGGDDGKVRVWDVTGGDPPTVLNGHRGGVWSVSYSPDGAFLASSGADGGVRIWRPDQPAPTVLRGYGSPVEGVAFGPAAEWLATVHDDGTVRVSRCEVCAPIERIEELAARLAVRGFTPEEQRQFLSPS